MLQPTVIVSAPTVIVSAPTKLAPYNKPTQPAYAPAPVANSNARPYADNVGPCFSMRATFGADWVHADADAFDVMVRALRGSNGGANE